MVESKEDFSQTLKLQEKEKATLKCKVECLQDHVKLYQFTDTESLLGEKERKLIKALSEICHDMYDLDSDRTDLIKNVISKSSYSGKIHQAFVESNHAIRQRSGKPQNRYVINLIFSRV